MSEEIKVSVIIRKYEFSAWGSNNFVIHLLKKQAEDVIYVETELIEKFAKNEDLFYSWLSNLFSTAIERGVVIEATATLNDTKTSVKLFKEPKLDSEWAFLPIPYAARLNKIIVLNEVPKSNEVIEGDSSSHVYDFSNEEYYVFFNPIKVLKEFYAIIILTNKGVEFIPLSEIRKHICIAKKQKTKVRKRRKRKKRKIKKSKHKH
ncbi:MAG: hypothetical protein LM572_04750 [Ignisphaera sp.]|jgi:hypothetical protein|nr:hypothetical protein [Ignisphaera sp.]MCC6056095.1 hypothetical protein [Desulfurococcaceae archaeon]